MREERGLLPGFVAEARWCSRGRRGGWSRAQRARQSSDANSAGRSKEPQPYSLLALLQAKVAAQERYHHW